MKSESTEWAVLASNRGARFVRCQAVNGRCRLQEIATFTNRWPTPKTGRPSSLRSPKNDHAYASLGHVSEEHLKKYAQDLVKWISARKREAGIGELVVAAPKRLHGLLRHAYPAGLRPDVQERVGAFDRPNLNSYARHRLFIELSGLKSKPRRATAPA